MKASKSAQHTEPQQEEQAASSDTATPNPKTSSLKDTTSAIGVFIAAIALAWLLVAFVFQSYRVNGSSMETTLQNSDHLIVWKVPRTLARITGHQYVPHRGDVIILNEPNIDSDVQSGADMQLVKRVVGLPGDRVVIKNGTLAIYDTAHPSGFDPDKLLPYGKVIPVTNGDVDLTLKPNQIYVLGDNRTNSKDSRIFGPVDTNEVIGKLIVRVLPINKAGIF